MPDTKNTSSVEREADLEKLREAEARAKCRAGYTAQGLRGEKLEQAVEANWHTFCLL